MLSMLTQKITVTFGSKWVLSALSFVVFALFASASDMKADENRDESVMALREYIAAFQSFERHSESGDLRNLLTTIARVQQADERVKLVARESRAFSILSDEQRKTCSAVLERCEATGHSLTCGVLFNGCVQEMQTDFKMDPDNTEAAPFAWKCEGTVCVCDSTSDCETMRRSCCKDAKMTTVGNSGACESATVQPSPACQMGSGRSTKQILEAILRHLDWLLG